MVYRFLNLMNLVEESFRRLYPGREFAYRTEIEYNRRLSSFNANIMLKDNLFKEKTIKVNLNLQWKDIDDEIKIGLIQHLLLKIFKRKSSLPKSIPNIDLYNNFIKNIPTLMPKTKSNPLLAMSFYRVNENFFDGLMEKPNLQWGQDSFRKLASYNFHDDTVTVSSLFHDAREEVLDYLMYHELLHKQHKFTQKNGRSRFHSTAFRQDEKSYPNAKEIEKELSVIIRTKRREQKKIAKTSGQNLWGFLRS